MDRRKFLQSTLITGAAGAFAPALAQPASSQSAPSIPSFELDETTITNLQSAMQSGRLSAHSLAEKYLGRISAIDKDKHGPAVNSVIELDPTRSRSPGARRGAQGQGVLAARCTALPILIKDNIDTADRMSHDRGIARARGPAVRATPTWCAPARGGRGDPRQDQPQRVGQPPHHAFDQRLERARRPHEEPLRARPHPERIEFRLARRRRRQSRRAIGTETDGSIVSPRSSAASWA